MSDKISKPTKQECLQAERLPVVLWGICGSWKPVSHDCLHADGPPYLFGRNLSDTGRNSKNDAKAASYKQSFGGTEFLQNKLFFPNPDILIFKQAV